MSGSYLDLERWPRRRHYAFYREYDQPFFNITADAEITALYQRTRTPGGPSLFLGCVYAAMRAANQVEEFRLRLRADGVWRHDLIHAGSTILRDDETFTFAYYENVEPFAEFQARGRAAIEAARANDAFDPQDERDDLLHFSALPWIRFTSFTPARQTDRLDAIPKIAFGRHFERERGRWLPVSVSVHHALVDGLHVGRFLQQFEQQIATIGGSPAVQVVEG